MIAVPLTGETVTSYVNDVLPIRPIHPDTLIQMIITKIINFVFMIVTWVAQLDNSYGCYVSDISILNQFSCFIDQSFPHLMNPTEKAKYP